ncbi:MAG: hypothetical protein SFY66_05450 [Oculatellaceae cyanobacterium bins.114]|nr:hypothetical protein [Oculatellaceae cyanobacterium bins.114]
MIFKRIDPVIRLYFIIHLYCTMLKLLRSPTLLPCIVMPCALLGVLVSGSHTPVRSQEYQGCFVMDAGGQVFDLSSICANNAQSSATPQLGTGDIQVTLQWATTDDLDLAVTDPSGATVTYSNRQIASGGQLDVDANAACSGVTRSPVENIFWPPGGAPQGQYNIQVNLYAPCGDSSGAIPFTLRLLVQGSTQTLRGSVNPQSPTVSFPFSLPRQ